GRYGPPRCLHRREIHRRRVRLSLASPSPPKKTRKTSPQRRSRRHSADILVVVRIRLAGPVSQIAPPSRESITVTSRRQDGPQTMGKQSRNGEICAGPRIDASLLEPCVPLQQIGQQRAGSLAQLYPSMQGPRGAADIVRRVGAVFANDVAVRERGEELEVERERRPRAIGRARQRGRQHGLAAPEHIFEGADVLARNTIAPRR